MTFNTVNQLSENIFGKWNKMLEIWTLKLLPSGKTFVAFSNIGVKYGDIYHFIILYRFTWTYYDKQNFLCSMDILSCLLVLLIWHHVWGWLFVMVTIVLTRFKLCTTCKNTMTLFYKRTLFMRNTDKNYILIHILSHFKLHFFQMFYKRSIFSQLYIYRNASSKNVFEINFRNWNSTVFFP